MKNGLVNIEIFIALDRIRGKHGVNVGHWAKVAWGEAESQVRVSELRARAEKRGGRPFTYKKCVALTEALRQIIGSVAMAKELLELIRKTDDRDERMILYCLAIPEEDKPATEMYLKAVVERASKS